MRPATIDPIITSMEVVGGLPTGTKNVNNELLLRALETMTKLVALYHIVPYNNATIHCLNNLSL